MSGIAPLVVLVAGCDVEVPGTVAETGELARHRAAGIPVLIVEHLGGFGIGRLIEGVGITFNSRLLVGRLPLEYRVRVIVVELRVLVSGR